MLDPPEQSVSVGPSPFQEDGPSGQTQLYQAQTGSVIGDVQAVPQSRSGSVASSIFGRQPQVPQEDDLSAIMMRGAGDLRNAKAEIEQQVCHSTVPTILVLSEMSSGGRLRSCSLN